MPDDPLGLFEQPDEIIRRQEDEKRLRIAYRNIFGGQDGEVVFDDLAKAAGFLKPNHVPGDPYSTAFNEGMRNLFLRILELSEYRRDLWQMKI